jgi:predicted transposase/invertase (TIGR01784 family)
MTSKDEEHKNSEKKDMTIKPARFLDVKSDLVFKKIFGQHPDLVKSFLNNVLPLPKDTQIETITYLNPEQVPVIPALKNTIVDVKCTDQYGRVFIVEMQMQWSDSFTKRLLFGGSKAYVQQMDKGEDYSKLCPVYGIGIINDVFEKQSEDWFHHYRHINVDKPDKTLEGIELIFIELPKFKPQTWVERKLGVLWLRFLKETDEHLTNIPEEFTQIPELSKAMELAQESSYTKAELEAYDKYWDVVSTNKTYLADSFKQGEQKGREEGKAEGREEGKAEGREEGANQKQLEIAIKMLRKGIDKEIISEITGLSLSEIESIK